MQHQLEVRLMWDKSVKKYLLCVVLIISRIFWRYLAGHVHVLQMLQILFQCFVKTSEVYLQVVFRICLYHDWIELLYMQHLRKRNYSVRSRFFTYFQNMIFVFILLTPKSSIFSLITFTETYKMYVKDILWYISGEVWGA